MNRTNVQNKPKPNTSAAKSAKPRRQRRNRRQNVPSGNEPSLSVGIASSKQQRTKTAGIVQRTARGVRIAHRELLASVSGSTGFTTLHFPVNPGLSGTFPWLAPQAIQWEMYRFHKLEFQYIQRSPTTAIGSVLMAPDYDAADQHPNTEQVMSTFQDCVEDATWQSSTCKLDIGAMHALGPRKYVRSVPLFGVDIKTYDVASFFFGTTGQANGDQIGKLWIDYDVEFFVAQSANLTGTPLPSASAEFYNDVDQVIPDGVATPIAFDALTFNVLGITSSAGGTLFRIPRGSWRLSIHCQFTLTALASGSLHIAQDGVVDNVVFSTNQAPAGLTVIIFDLERLITTNGLHDFSVEATINSAGVTTAQDHRCNLIVEAA